MQVMLTCECGQGLRTEVGQTAVRLTCPSCGKQINVWPPAGATAGLDQPKACTGAIVAFVLGMCGLVPVLGVLTAIPAIILGLVLLRRKRPGRGFTMAGLFTALGALLTIQVGVVLYAIMVYQMVSQTMAMIPTVGQSVTYSTSIAAALPEEIAVSPLTATEVADALTFGSDVREDAEAASASLDKARLLYDSRELPGHRYECLQQYSLHMASRGRSDFADPADGVKHLRVYDELLKIVLAEYDRAEQLEDGCDWSGAEKAYEVILAEVPGSNNAINVNARTGVLRCKFRSGDPGAVVDYPAMPPSLDPE